MYPLFPSKYIHDLYGKGKKNWKILVPNYFKRFFQILFLRNYDILFIEYELFPFVPYFFEKLALFGKKNIVLDYDDATFHTYDKHNYRIIHWFCGNKIYKLANKASLIITGSPYLTKVLKEYNKNIIEIPTSINFNKYQIFNKTVASSTISSFKIGWVGSKNTSVNILPLKEVFIELQKKANIELVLIGFDNALLHNLKGVNYKSVTWRAETEIETISSFDVGIMPLEDKFFNYGKCGFKLIQYMACGIPTIATPLEANVKINRENDNLFATTNAEWMLAFEKILKEKVYYKNEVGKANKEIVKKFYSTESNEIIYVSVFNTLMQQVKH